MAGVCTPESLRAAQNAEYQTEVGPSAKIATLLGACSNWVHGTCELSLDDGIRLNLAVKKHNQGWFIRCGVQIESNASSVGASTAIGVVGWPIAQAVLCKESCAQSEGAEQDVESRE